jgi:hypothetical protein
MIERWETSWPSCCGRCSSLRGTGVFGKLGGGEVQRSGVEALAAWFASRDH